MSIGNNFTARANTPPPQVLYLGNVFFSIIPTLNPDEANSIPAAPPAGPVPTIATSKSRDPFINQIRCPSSEIRYMHTS